MRGICVVVPAAALLAAHWFPWRKAIKRDLHRLEAYTIGTSMIVGTAAAAMSSDGSPSGREHAKLLLTATMSAGFATVLAWWIDAFIRANESATKARKTLEVADELRPQPN